MSDDTLQTYASAPLRGINLSGAEAGSDVSYAYQGMPSLSTDMGYYIDRGMNTVRFPIKWSYITESIDADTASESGATYLSIVAQSIEEMLDAGLYVILDFHSYMRFSPDSYAGNSNEIASASDMYNVWSIVSDALHEQATAYPDHLILEIANEPNRMDTMQVLANNNAGIDAIRDASLTNMIIIQGNSWSGLHSWHKPGSATDGLSNAEVLIPANIVDPLNNYAIAVHQYVDWNGSGTSPVGQELNDFINYANFDEFMDWVHEHDVKVILDEFGSGSDANSIADVNYLLTQVEANGYVEGEGGFLGWATWVGGHTWAQHNFNYVGPNPDGTDNIQMAQIYMQHLTPLDESIVIPDSTIDIDGAIEDALDQNDDNTETNQDNNDTTPPPPPPVEVSPGSHPIDWDWGAREVITGFDVSQHKIDLSEFWTNYDTISVSEDRSGNLTINLLDVDNHTVTLENVSLADFNSTNIVGVAGLFANGVIDHPVDYYTYGWNYGTHHVIDDFDVSSGVIELVAFNHGFSDISITYEGSDSAVVDLGFNSQTISLNGLQSQQLTADNFYGLSGSFAEVAVAISDPVDPGTNVGTDTGTDTGANDGPQGGQVYAYGWSWGNRDEVADFNAATDTVDLSAYWISFDKVKVYEDGDGNVVIDLVELNNHAITLENTSLSEFGADNIVGVTGDYDSSVQSDPMKLYTVGWNYGAESEIDNFNPEVGIIDLTAFNHSYNEITISNDSDGNAVVNLAFDNQTITLNGVDSSEITEDNFFGV